MGSWVCHCPHCGEYRIIKGLMAGDGLVLALRIRYESLGGGGGEGRLTSQGKLGKVSQKRTLSWSPEG